ncbi:MAG TPA: VWA domain-containing protein, partial [Planctomycetaceae bacterium]|nr:VWA domain-containing protein [Planctomycetaceae bacterium]
MPFLRRLLLQLFPTPRRAVRWMDALPLAVFFALFAATCVGLEWGGVLLFARPWALALAVFAAWIWWLHVAGYAGLPRLRGRIAFWTRLGLFSLMVMVLAEPRSVRTRDVVSAMFLVDVSDSVRGDSVDAAMRYVAESAALKPTADEVGLLIFGKTPAVEQGPRMSYIVEALNSVLDRGSTNVETAMSLGAAMLPDDKQGRLIVISDGAQTEGNLSRVLDDLKSRGIAVDVLPVDYSYDAEVWLERLDLPQQVKIGETYEAAMVLSSLQAGEGKLTLRENGETIAEQTVKFQPGKNRYTVPLTLRAPGYYEYTATIEVDRAADSLSQNNSVLGYIFVEGEGQVLLVYDPAGDKRDWETLEETMRQAERAVKAIPAFDFPNDTAALMPYDCIIFCNVPFDAFDFGQLAGLKDAVYNVGIGFLMVGGNNSFGPGGWHRTVVEEILPVSMDINNKKVLPKGALAIILHTCEFPEGNTWAKRITKQAIKVLSAQDEAGVLAYTAKGEDWIFPLTPISDYEKIVPLIDGASVGDMPSFQTTMQLGLTGLLKSDAATKHMIIISDGDPSPSPPTLLQQFVDNQISVSTVAVFPHGGMEQQSLQLIASATGGRYYFVNDNPDVLPSIFIKESKTLKRSMIQNKTITPRLGFPSPVLKGLDGLPELKGYVLTNAKPSPAMTLMLAPPDEQDPTQEDPILAIWQHGLGKTAAFTSDLSPNWAKSWQDWEHYQAFVKQLIQDISRERKTGSLRLSTYTSGGEAVLVAEDFHSDEAFLEVTAKLAGPDGKSEIVRLKQVSPRRYQATVPLWGHGRYHAVAQAKGSGRDEQAFGGFIVSYSPEYLRFRSNRQTLSEIAERTNGRLLTGDAKADDIYHAGRQVKK